MRATRIAGHVFLLLMLGGALVYEASFILRTSADAATKLRLAEAKSGEDSASRSVKALKAEAKGDLAVVDAAALKKPELVGLIDLLEKTGRLQNLTVNISSITSDTLPLSSTSPETVRISVEADGSWSSNLAFVHILESLPYKAALEKVDLRIADKGWRSSATVRISVFPKTP